MDDEESEFYPEELNFKEDPIGGFSEPIQDLYFEEENKEPTRLRVLNYCDGITKGKQNYLNMIMHGKAETGPTYLINSDKKEELPEFFSEINSESYNPDWAEKPLHFKEYLEYEDKEEQSKKKLTEIEEKMIEITKRCFSEINLTNNGIQNMMEHFENFLLLKSNVTFIKNLENHFFSFTEKIKEKKLWAELIIEIFKFWIKIFEDFILNIMKHNERYTLKTIKKIKEHNDHEVINPKVTETEKRKAWTAFELKTLDKVLQSTSKFNQVTINKIAEELNRTPASVSSKIQKLIKENKNVYCKNEHENITLAEKIINVLRNYPNGLSCESIIERVNEHYEMEDDLSWQKSVAQILSSRIEFVKIKGTYSLNGKFEFDMSKKAFKDKVVNCLLMIPEGKADFKKLVDQYICLYEMSDETSMIADERRRIIEANISKSLCRNDIFNKENSKTVYKLRQFTEKKDEDINMEGFFD